MAYNPLFQESDTIAAGSSLLSGATSCTITNGNFGTPTGTQLYVVDAAVPGTAEIISASVVGTAVTSVVRGLAGGAPGTTNHFQNATIGSLWVPQFLGNGLGAIASNDAWTAWSPTYSAGGSMTLGSVTTNLAHYFQVGKMVFYRLDSSGGTIGGTPANALRFTAPITAKDTFGSPGTGFASDTNGTYGAFAAFVSASVIAVEKYSQANFATGGSGGMVITGCYEAA